MSSAGTLRDLTHLVEADVICTFHQSTKCILCLPTGVQQNQECTQLTQDQGTKVRRNRVVEVDRLFCHDTRHECICQLYVDSSVFDGTIFVNMFCKFCHDACIFANIIAFTTYSVRRCSGHLFCMRDGHFLKVQLMKALRNFMRAILFNN